jgi:hypothetical protein
LQKIELIHVESDMRTFAHMNVMQSSGRPGKVQGGVARSYSPLAGAGTVMEVFAAWPAWLMPGLKFSNQTDNYNH